MKKRTEVVQADNYLMYVPQKKHGDWETKGGKVRLLFYHDKAAERFLRWLVKKPPVSDLELDEAGSKTWLEINGVTTVYEIGKALNREFGTDFDPEYKRLILFLNYLNRKGWISFRRISNA